MFQYLALVEEKLSVLVPLLDPLEHVFRRAQRGPIPPRAAPQERRHHLHNMQQQTAGTFRFKNK
jgi:hypothetical protein